LILQKTRQRIQQIDNSIGYISIIGAIIAATFASVLIRLAQNAGMESPAIASFRLSIASAVIFPYVIRHYRGEFHKLKRRDLMFIAISGFWLGSHFILYVTALEYTSVMISSVVVTTSPLWVSLMESVFLRVKLHQFVWIGIILAMIGGMFIALLGRDLEVGTDPLFGALLALGGAITVGIYMLIGRQVRTRVPFVPYIWMVYSFASIVTLIYVFITRTPLTGYSIDAYFWVIMVTVVAQLMGHTSINLALRYFSATYVSISGQLGAIGATIVALILFEEVPTIFQVIGASGIILGVIFASIGNGRSVENHQSPTK